MAALRLKIGQMCPFFSLIYEPGVPLPHITTLRQSKFWHKNGLEKILLPFEANRNVAVNIV